MAKVVPLSRHSVIKDNQTFSWLQQVQQDRAISSTGFELAFVLMQYVNRESGYAWPTQETLGNAISASDRTVRTLLEALAAHGHIAIEHSRGRNISNRYKLVLKTQDNRKPTSGYDPENEEVGFRSNDEKQEDDFPISGKERPEEGFRSSEQKAEADFPSTAPITGNLLHDNRKFSARKQEASFLQNQSHEPVSIKHAADGVRIADLSLQADRISSAEIFSAALPGDHPIKPAAQKPEAELFRRGKEILGASAGGFISKLLKAKGGNVALARAAIETASTAENPREYLGAIIKGRDSPDDLRTRGFAW